VTTEDANPPAYVHPELQRIVDDLTVNYARPSLD
jgi:hypothetical protein